LVHREPAEAAVHPDDPNAPAHPDVPCRDQALQVFPVFPSDEVMGDG